MKSNKLLIQINKPIEEVFSFTVNPENTPKWIDSIVKEETNEWPIKIGSIYKNQGKDGNWSEYVVTEFKENKMFVFTKRKYNVKYIFRPTNSGTELEYFEWVNNGNLEEPFTEDILKKLKEVLENE